jgi:hypothetical protein
MGKKLHRNLDRIGETEEERATAQETEAGFYPETENGISRNSVLHVKHGKRKHTERP